MAARKLYADGQGKETQVPVQGEFQVGLFAAEPGKKGFKRDSVLLMERRALQDGAQQLVLRSSAEPKFAGVDPYNTHIDRNTDDNVVAVKAGS